MLRGRKGASSLRPARCEPERLGVVGGEEEGEWEEVRSVRLCLLSHSFITRSGVVFVEQFIHECGGGCVCVCPCVFV